MKGALLVAAFSCPGAGALLDLFVGTARRAARPVPYALALVGSGLLLGLGIHVVATGAQSFSLGSLLAMGTTTIRVDDLAALFLTLLFAIGIAVSACTVSWVRREASPRRARRVADARDWQGQRRVPPSWLPPSCWQHQELRPRYMTTRRAGPAPRRRLHAARPRRRPRDQRWTSLSGTDWQRPLGQDLRRAAATQGTSPRARLMSASEPRDMLPTSRVETGPTVDVSGCLCTPSVVRME